MYRALADLTRRQILDELVERDGLTLFDICGRLIMKHHNGSTRQAISQHLVVLEEANLVRSHREGRTKVHHLNTAPLREIPQRWPTKNEESRYACTASCHERLGR
ncbi:MAG: metalloregulator ArsR/SmtB family transcription factor [Ornithinimicrobium sp.]